MSLLDLFAPLHLFALFPFSPPSPEVSSGRGVYTPDSGTYTYYLGGMSIHMCTQLYTHVYTTVYTRVHYLALSMSPEDLSRMAFLGANT